MARFKIISKDGSSVKYEGKLRYIGSYLKPSYVEFSEISSPTPINWEIGDYVDYSRTGMRYRLFSVPQVVKNARAGSHGSAFSYTNVQFFAATKELEIALFRDLVSGDNNIHFSTSPDVATFEDVAGIARRIQACMDDLYPGKWVIKVADFDAESDAEVIEKITTAKDFALSGGTCLDALSKIYELWQDIGWIHSYDPTREKDIITIGYANKRIDANTTDAFLYGKGNGLTAIKKSQANKEEFATRLYVYGSERNLPSRYYNDKDILNAESVDIRNLMLPMDVWGRTDGKPDARKAYIENAEAVAKIGVIPRVHYFDSEEAGADIYPSIEGMTVGMLRKVLSDMGDTAYSPSYEIYADASERVDEVGGVISLPTDEGKISEAIELTTISIPSFSKTKSTGIVESVDLIESHILYEGLIKSSFEMGEITVKPSLECTVNDADFSSVVATLTLDDSLGASTSSPSKTISIPAEYDESRNLWVLPLKDISVKFDRKTNSNGFYIYLYVTISATKNTPGVSNDAVVSIYRGTADVEVKQILSKTFNIRLKQIGFNLNLQADLGQGKTISMKTGKCAGRNFVISSARYSPSSDSWDITCKRQQDETLGLLFPNTNYEIQAGDRFVLLDIVMPESYIRVAMERLLAEGQRLFSQVSTVRSNYEPSIDAKLMAESGRHLREGMFMEISDSDIVDNTTEHILIDTLSIYEDESAIPTYKVTLRERRKVTYKGTPSAAATTKTSSVEDGETDMSEYAKTAYVDKKDKEFSSTLSKILDWFTLTDGVLLTKYNLASEKEVSAKGINASQGGGTSYNRLDSWSAYDSSKAGYVLSALLGYDLHSRVTTLENAEVDLSDYYTKSQTNSQIASAIGAIDLSPYATKAALNILEGKHNTLRNEFDALNNLLSSDTTDYINTWNEVVAFLDGYKDESNLATILSGMNADISSRLLASTFESWKADTYTPLANLVANHTTRLDGLDQSILSINTRIDGVDKTIEDHIAEFIAFRANFEITDNLILVKKNFASTKEISAHGINQGNGGGGSSFSRLDAWADYDSNKAGYVLSALLGYDLHSRVTVLENKEVDLSNYYTKGQTDNRISAAISKIDFTPYATNDALSELGEDVQLRLLSSEFATWETNTFTPLAIRVSQAEEDIDTNATNIAKANNNISTLDALTKQHSTKIAANEENIGTKADQSSLDAAVEDIAANAEDIIKANKNISNLDSLTKEHTSQISGLDTLTKQHASQITSLDTLTKQHTTKINGLETLTSTHTSQISGLETRVTVAEGNIANHDSEIDNLDKRIKTFESWFELVDGNIKTTFNFYSTKQISALGLEAGNGGGGSSYSRLDSWSAYDSSKAGYVLSALLGQDLNTRLIAVENKEVDLTGYYTKAQTDAKISSAVGAIDFTPYAKSADVAKTYATIAALNLIDGRVGNLEKAGYATTGYVDAAISGIDFSPYATTEELNEAIEGIDLTPFAKSADVALTYATKNELTASINGLSISQYAKSSDVEATYATKEALTSAINGLNISQYATTAALDKAISDLNISQYAKSTDVASTYATIAALSGLTDLHNNLRSEFDALNSLLNDDTAGVIDTWNEVVDFINEYSGSDNLETILVGMNKNIDLRLLASDFNAWVANTYTPLAYRVGVAEENIGKNATAIANNKSDIDKLLGWFKIDSDGNVYTEHNFYSTQQISAKGLNAGGGSGSSYNRLDAWTDYDSNKAGYVLSASLGYGLKVAIDELNGYDLDNRVRSIENSYVSKDAGGVVNGGLVVSSLAVSGGSSSQFLKADGSLDSTSYLSTAGGTISNGIWAYQLNLNALNTDAGLRFSINGALKGVLRVDSNQDLWYQGASENLLLHSGNVGGYALQYYGTKMPSNIVNYVGYGMAEEGWNHYGPVISFGFGAYYAQMQMASNGSIFSRISWEGSNSDWKTIAFTDSDITGNAAGLHYTNAVSGYYYFTPYDYGFSLGGQYASLRIRSSNIYNCQVTFADNNDVTRWSLSYRGANNADKDFYLAKLSEDEAYTPLIALNYSSENVLIGTTTDNGAKLQVESANNVVLSIKGTTYPEASIRYEGSDGKVWTAGKGIMSHGDSFGFYSATAGRDIVRFTTEGAIVNGILTVGGASIHPTANNPYFQLYQNNNYWYWQADNSNTYIGGTMSKALRIDQDGNTLIRGSLGVDALLTASNGLTVSGLSTFTGGVVAYDIHGNGQSLYLGNASNNAFIKVREDMVGSTSMWSIPRDGKATFTSLTTPTLSVTGSATIASVTIDAGNATLSNLTVNTAATLKQLVVGIDGMSCNGPATFNDFIYGSSITPRTDNYYVLGNNNYKWYGVTAYNVNVHEAITIEAGKELRFKDDNGVVHTLKYDSTKQAFVFDGNVNATGEMSAKKLNA